MPTAIAIASSANAVLPLSLINPLASTCAAQKAKRRASTARVTPRTAPVLARQATHEPTVAALTGNDCRAMRLSTLRQNIAQGSYCIPASVVADSMLQFLV